MKCEICKKVESQPDDYACTSCRIGLDDYAADMDREEADRQKYINSLQREKCHTSCSECGIFISRDYWVDKELGDSALCHEHLMESIESTY